MRGGGGGGGGGADAAAADVDVAFGALGLLAVAGLEADGVAPELDEGCMGPKRPSLGPVGAVKDEGGAFAFGGFFGWRASY